MYEIFSSDLPLGLINQLFTIEYGAQQGSVLGPLIFLIYVNDLEKNKKTNINSFVDGTMLFSIEKNPVIPGNDLNHD